MVAFKNRTQNSTETFPQLFYFLQNISVSVDVKGRILACYQGPYNRVGTYSDNYKLQYQVVYEY